MKELENQDADAVIEHLRWLITQKQEYFKSFEARGIQILGINGIFLALIWTNLFTNRILGIIEFILIIFYLFSIFLQIIILITIGKPKKSEKPLLAEKTRFKIINNMEEYYQFISKHLASRAKKTSYVYNLFIFQVAIFILLVFLIII